MVTPAAAALRHTDSRPVGSPAWKPQATLALVTRRSIAASSPRVHRPNDSPRSALRSMVVIGAAPGRAPRALTRRPGPWPGADAGAGAAGVRPSPRGWTGD